MALVKCPDCSKKVSEHAADCPGCGYPIAQKIDHIRALEAEEEKYYVGRCDKCAEFWMREKWRMDHCNTCGGTPQILMSRDEWEAFPEKEKERIAKESLEHIKQGSSFNIATYNEYYSGVRPDQDQLQYCPLCGEHSSVRFSQGRSNCEYCGTAYIKADINYVDFRKKANKYAEEQGKKYAVLDEEYLLKDFLSKEPDFRLHKMMARQGQKNQHIQQSNAALARLEKEQANQPKCPTCSSINVSKIGIIRRGVSMFFAGAASNKFNKSFECNKCGMTW